LFFWTFAYVHIAHAKRRLSRKLSSRLDSRKVALADAALAARQGSSAELVDHAIARIKALVMVPDDRA
jgi:hypothetical protein